MHRLHGCALVLVALLSFANAGCVETLPPPPAPAQDAIPKGAALLPPSPGKGRVLLDATNGPARVDEIVGTESGVVYGRRGAYATESEIAKPLCNVTPCAANLDYGQHDIRFTSLDNDLEKTDAVANVRDHDSAFVGTMGETYPGGPPLHVLGRPTQRDGSSAQYSLPN